ncbi:hypothetical protein [Acidocella sp.]|uniref:hypothetical protein n=1 Tax=Acidocella sp. TaxID=50710 RepID=UPI0026152374|nr:hypothetical protein [Acidocella sp.]
MPNWRFALVDSVVQDAITMPYCFVIQPFDGGRFDKRFDDVFKPAIEEAELEAYRIDKDPSVSIPINEIESGIRGASVCFADITLDNPNVWFELGYALASDKEICLICSEERKTQFPFDVQHRNIIKYNVDSPSDYHSLKVKITTRLKALGEKTAKLAVISVQSPIKEESGLSQHEMIVLAAIMENRDGPGGNVSHWTIKNDLDTWGYNNIALNIGLEKLIGRGLIAAKKEHDPSGEFYNVYYVEEAGMTWLLDNSDRLELNSRKASTPHRATRWGNATGSNRDDEIPF